MGKFLVKIGLKLQTLWCKLQCKWNWIISRLMFDVADCPYKLCKCKK